MASNTERTIRWMKEEGWIATKVECWLPRANVRRDAFGIFDYLALDGKGIVGVQSTGQGVAEHKRKILASPYALPWLRNGGRILLIGWRKIKKKRGGKQMIWAPRLIWITEEDFDEGPDSM